jgi:ribose 5-phosphate isomerase B
LRLAAASDHAGYPLKAYLVEKLSELHEVVDLGTEGPESVNYPVYAHRLCREVLSGSCELGILVCNSGIGMSIAANRHPGIRAALCLNTTMASFARRHNDANVLVLAGGFTAPFHAWEIVSAFLAGGFEGGRHARRLEMLDPEDRGD